MRQSATQTAAAAVAVPGAVAGAPVAGREMLSMLSIHSSPGEDACAVPAPERTGQAVW